MGIHSDDHYREVADAYRKAILTTPATSHFIAEKWEVPMTTANRWIRRARELGYLEQLRPVRCRGRCAACCTRDEERTGNTRDQAERVLAAIRSYEFECERQRREQSEQTFGNVGAFIPNCAPSDQGRIAAIERALKLEACFEKGKTEYGDSDESSEI